jgi:hypothetical protein
LVLLGESGIEKGAWFGCGKAVDDKTGRVWGRGAIALLHLVLAEELGDVSFLGEVNADGVGGDSLFKVYTEEPCHASHKIDFEVGFEGSFEPELGLRTR